MRDRFGNNTKQTVKIIKMGDWNTLHHFNDKKFYTEIVPDLLTNGELLKKYYNLEYAKYITYPNDNITKRIDEIISFNQLLDKDFKHHKTLFDIQNGKKEINEEYSEFIKKRNQREDDFYRLNGHIIEDFNQILTLIVFSESAAFNPHLILGRTVFNGNIIAKSKSVAEDIIHNFTNSKLGSIYNQYSGFINWITYDELQLLWLDKENLQPASDSSKKYFSDFYKFIEIAIENELGLISGTNMNERILKLIKSPLSVKIDLKEQEFVNVINYE